MTKIKEIKEIKEIQKVIKRINALEHQVKSERINALEHQVKSQRINALEHQVIILLDSINGKSLKDHYDLEKARIKEKIQSNLFGVLKKPLKNQCDAEKARFEMEEHNRVQLKMQFGLTFADNSIDNTIAEELIKRVVLYKGYSKKELSKVESAIEMRASTNDIHIFKSILRIEN